MAISAPASSLTSKLRVADFGGEALDVRYLGAKAVFALGNGHLVIGDGESARTLRVHGGTILCMASDGRRVLTGGDDGRVVATTADGASETLAEHKLRWIDQVACGADGAYAYSQGKTVHFRPAKGEEKRQDFPSTVGGLAFAPKGTRLAVAHYGGASLWFPNASAKPEFLAWKGSHRGVLFHPEGRFLVTTMQEPALHGWKLPEGTHMRMSGYPARVRSMAFTAGGRHLATSGSTEAILWPFIAKDGPMGKQPTMLAPRDVRVSAVAAHPKDEVLLVGYEDGMTLLVRISDGAEILVRAPGSGAVSALGWRADGGAIAIGTESGAGGFMTL